ncbi:MAG: DinB family protein [Ignavibacteria bacterium]|nr:DinB family protein [Ignavibacteria bacterium]
MPVKNSADQINLLKWMLEDLRKVTLEGVKHLTKEQLFTPPVENEFCIGSYIMHLAEVDLGWYETLSGEKASDDIKKRSYYNCWFDSGPDFNPPNEAPEYEEYFKTIEATRKIFLDYVSSLIDSDLDENVITKRRDGDVSIPKKWIIYHIIEHEAHTRGQMFMLIRMAGWNKSSSD